MQNIIAILLIVAVTICLGGGSTFSQDFGALLEAIEKIENNLKELIKEEATARGRQFSKLESAIARNQKSNKASSVNGVSEKQLADITNELLVLRLKIAELGVYFENNARQFVSLDDFSPQAADQQVVALDARLDAISHNVQDLMNGQHKPAQTHQSENEHSKTTVSGKLFSHGLVNITDNEGSHSEFALSRAYLTVRSQLSEHSDIRITTDLRTIDEKYNIILKYAYFDWKPAFSGGIMGLRVGLQPTEYIDYMNKLWGRRYAAPTIGDLHHFVTSSDLGVSTNIGFGSKSEYGFVRLSLLNGTSYTHVQEQNSRKDFNIVTLLTPFKGSANFKHSSFLMQFYTGTQNESLDDLMSTDSSVTPWDTTVTVVSGADWKRQIVSLGGAFVWDHTLDLGIDMNFLTLGKGPQKAAVKKQGLSFFGALYFHNFTHNSFLKSLGIIGRLDLYDPDTGTADNNETLIVFGIESKPMYSLKMALNYRISSFQDNTRDTENTLFLNTQFKF